MERCRGTPADRTTSTSRSGKCERLVEMLEEMLEEGDSALVFTQYKEMGDMLEQLLHAAAAANPVLYLHGGTPAQRAR